jgi:hypothetical protein
VCTDDVYQRGESRFASLTLNWVFCAEGDNKAIKNWSLTSLKEKLIKVGAKVVSHDRYVAFQMAEVAIPRNLFADILRLIAELRPPPVTSTA